jgi:sucrose-6-phosphate hydrolase SacC (GH32 family)
VDGDPADLKWVLIRGNGHYSVGEFDGQAFHEDAPQTVSDFGPNFYATQSWEGPHGRRIQLAWMREGSYPDMPFNQQLSFPCELSLHRDGDSVKLLRKPVPEIATIQGPAQPFSNVTISPGAKLSLASSGDLFRLVLKVDFSPGATLTVHVRGTAIEIGSSSLSSVHSSSASPHPIQRIEMLVDRTSIETFTNDGELSLSQCFLPKGDEISLESKGGAVTLVDGQVYPLHSIWP